MFRECSDSARPRRRRGSAASTPAFVAEAGPLLGGLDDADEFDHGLEITLDGFLRGRLPG
jgi:hypothetical protein